MCIALVGPVKHNYNTSHPTNHDTPLPSCRIRTWCPSSNAHSSAQQQPSKQATAPEP